MGQISRGYASLSSEGFLSIIPAFKSLADSTAHFFLHHRYFERGKHLCIPPPPPNLRLNTSEVYTPVLMLGQLPKTYHVVFLKYKEVTFYSCLRKEELSSDWRQTRHVMK